MTKLHTWIPDRKVWAGGLSAILAWLLVKALQEFVGLTVDPEVASTLVGFVTAYLVPPADADIVKHVTNEIVAEAIADPTNPTTASQPAPRYRKPPGV